MRAEKATRATSAATERDPPEILATGERQEFSKLTQSKTQASRALPPATDLLGRVIDRARSKLADPAVPVKTRVRALWAYCKAARHCGSSDVVIDEFTALADATGLAADLGWHGREDVSHVLHWALCDRNPFED